LYYGHVAVIYLPHFTVVAQVVTVVESPSDEGVLYF
jgi:hypothetical protein